jgi:membrane protease YdiL (CAAX protease family)
VVAVLAAYAAVAAASVCLAVAFGLNPVAGEGWLPAPALASALVSLGLGICLGATTIAATRAIVLRAQWGRTLHAALRPAVSDRGDGMLLTLALASASAEELLFRGVLVPATGVIVSSLVFGLLHQIRGRARLAWIAWATLMGMLFALIFKATGSLAGPLVAHAAINYANFRFLRDNDPDARPRLLGGLLKR